MPAIVTHDTFAHESFARTPDIIGQSSDERDAFILGNQGPDPLFFSRMDVRFIPLKKLGNTFHDENTTQLIAALREAVDMLPEKQRAVGRAYALGFLGHYALDRAEHPLIFGEQFDLCDAGVEGLSREDGHQLHAYIECELDELLLYTKRNETIATFRPWQRVLIASDKTLDTISLMYAYLALKVYGVEVPRDLFTKSVHCYRLLERFLYTPASVKRRVFSTVERLVNTHSYYNAAAEHDVKRTDTPFANREHLTWENPFTQEKSDASFDDLYEQAHRAFLALANAFETSGFNEAAARTLTHDIDFSGKPLAATC